MLFWSFMFLKSIFVTKIQKSLFERIPIQICLFYPYFNRGSLKNDSKFQVKHKITYVFFETLFCPIHPRNSCYSRKYHYFFFSENNAFTLPSPSSPYSYNFAIDINTSTTINYQIESVNALKFRFFLILSHFLSTQTTYLTLFSQNSLKKTEDFEYKLCKVHKLTILKKSSRINRLLLNLTEVGQKFAFLQKTSEEVFLEKTSTEVF